MGRILSLSITLTSLVFAEQINSIEYRGLYHLSPDMASEISGIHEGDRLDVNRVDEALKKFYKQGYFSDIVVYFNEGGRLVFDFKEKSTISRLDIEGYDGYSTEEEKEALFIELGLKKGDLYDKEKIERAKKKLIRKIEAEGYYDTVVEVKVEPKADSVAVIFEVNKGDKIHIKHVDFEGVRSVDRDELEDVLANREEDSLGWLIGFNDGVAHLDQLELDAKRVQDFYLSKGFLDVKVENPILRVDNGSYIADLTFNVYEGDRYIVRDVDIIGLIDGVDKSELLDELNIKKGKVFNIQKLRKDMELIRESVANLGYAYAKVVPRFNQDKENRVVDINYMVKVGDKVYINDVIISGNYSTQDSVIRRDIYLAPGDLFSLKDLKDSISALRRRGYFESVEIIPQKVDDNRVNLIVKVKETATGSISLGGGYGSYQKFMVNAALSDRNIFGSGIGASFSMDFSKVSSNYSFSINNPRLFDSEYSFGLSVYKNKYEYPTYRHDTFGAGFNVGKQLTRNIHAYVGYSYSENDIDTNDTTDSLITSVFSDEDLSYAKSTLSIGATFDNTDDYFVPRRGIVLGGKIAYSGLGGDEEFTEYSTKFGAYYGMEDLIDYDLIFRYKLRANVLQDNGHISGPERLFLGGVSTVRGYRPYTIAPSEYGVNEDGETTRKIIGGKKSMVNTIEASIPISQAAKMRLTFFFDYGMIGIDSFDEIKRAGYGTSIEWYSPIGPINLIFGRALDKGVLERTSSFEFTIGRRF